MTPADRYTLRTTIAVIIAILAFVAWGCLTACKAHRPHRHIRKAMPHETHEQSKAALKAEINTCTHKSHKK